MARSTTVVFLMVAAVAVVTALKPCPGDTRGNKQCNWDSTHRVCAKIGVKGTSFWHFTKQRSWCQTIGYYGGPHGRKPRCPADKPTWCICKWATARWIAGEGCNEKVQFDCEATDVCNLKRSYRDYNVNLKPAHDCMAKKCKTQWDACPKDDGKLTVDRLHEKYYDIFPRTRNRNAASHLWASYVIDNAASLTEKELYELFGGFCPISGSIVRPGARNLYKNIQLKKASNTNVVVSGNVHVCCWPCICDLQQAVRVDPMEIKTKEGVKTFDMLVIGDPCIDEKKIPRSASELQCKNKKLVKAKRSKNGYVVIGMSQKATKIGYGNPEKLKDQCYQRKMRNYRSGMGKIFLNVAKINPIN